jgi:hypothetical protein
MMTGRRAGEPGDGAGGGKRRRPWKMRYYY